MTAGVGFILREWLLLQREWFLKRKVVEERNGALVTALDTAKGWLGPDLPFQVPHLQVSLRGDPACASFYRLTCQ
jgi:hypothetical protein